MVFPTASVAMASNVATREISPLLQKLRSFLNGREVTIPLRFQKEMAPRPGPEANLPEGPSHKVASNYYFTRDGRREVGFPTVLADQTAAKAKSLAAGGEAAAAVAKVGKRKTPGAVYKYSQ